jgi:PBP1b-binding outer membrane lipoprotein LpoB
MKKTVSFLAMAVMILTLSGCMDDPNQGNPKPKGYGTPNQEGTGVK